VLLINIPIGVAVLFGTRTLTDDQRHTGRLDTLGAVTGTGGVMALAYGFTRSGEHGWTNALTLAAFAAAAVLLVLFVVLQARNEHPLLPLWLLEDRDRAGSYATVLFIGAGLMGTFYLATLFMQQVLLYGPLKAGLAALPFGFGIVLASGVASELAERLSPRAIAVPGLVLAAAGVFWLSTLDADSGYWTHLMVPVFLASAGLGLAFVPMTLTVVHGVDPQETGVASALLNTAQQVGAALGLAVLTTVSASAAATTLPDAPQTLHRAVAADDQPLVEQAAEALAHGYGTGFLVAAGLLLLAAAVTGFAVTVGPQQPQDETATATPG
jgi:predicted MFS family arabinose efflux permease